MYNISFRTVMHAEQHGGKFIHESLEINGVLNFRVYEILKNKVKIGFQISPVNIRTSARKSNNAENIFLKLFFVEISKDGRFEKFSFSNEIAVEDERTIQDIILTFQVIIKRTIFNSWTIEEQHTNGAYLANYVNNKECVEKSKLEYIKLIDFDGQTKPNEKVEIKKSNTLFYYDEDTSWITKAEGNELVVFYSKNKSYLKTSTSVKLDIIPFDPEKSLSIWNNSKNYDEKVTQWQSLPKNTVSLTRQSETQIFKNKFGDKDIVEVANDLFKKHRDFNAQCMGILIEYLQLNSKSAKEFPGYLLSARLNPTQRVMMVHALERAGHTEAQSALTRIMQGAEFKKESRTQAAIAFGSIEKPTDETINNLFDTYDNRYSKEKDADHIARTAALSLGAMAKNLEESSNDNYNQTINSIKEKITSDLQGNPDLNTKVALLHAIGNTADEDLMDDITSYFTDQNPRVRSAAVNSLAYMEDEEVNEILRKELPCEEDINVRNSIVSTMYRKEANEESVRTIIDTLPSEENDIVRGQMYRYLLKNREFPGVKDALINMLESEKSTEHKKIIRRAISTKKKSSTKIKY